jgi:hypothetical protein
LPARPITVWRAPGQRGSRASKRGTACCSWSWSGSRRGARRRSTGWSGSAAGCCRRTCRRRLMGVGELGGVLPGDGVRRSAPPSGVGRPVGGVGGPGAVRDRADRPVEGDGGIDGPGWRRSPPPPPARGRERRGGSGGAAPLGRARDRAGPGRQRGEDSGEPFGRARRGREGIGAPAVRRMVGRPPGEGVRRPPVAFLLVYHLSRHGGSLAAVAAERKPSPLTDGNDRERSLDARAGQPRRRLGIRGLPASSGRSTRNRPRRTRRRGRRSTRRGGAIAIPQPPSPTRSGATARPWPPGSPSGSGTRSGCH